MPFTIVVECTCGTCGNTLAIDWHGAGEISVEVCDDCMKRVRQEGYDEGDESGYSRGLSEGREDF